MQAIVCKYLPPTAHRGSRIKATAAAGSVTVGYYDTDGDVFLYAAEKLVEKMGWKDVMLLGGVLPNRDNVYIMVKR